MQLFSLLLVGSLLVACATSSTEATAVNNDAVVHNGATEKTPNSASVEETEFAETSFIAEEKLPRILALPQPVWKTNLNVDQELTNLIRGTVENYLIGKGFRTVSHLAVDRCSKKTAKQPQGDEQVVRGMQDCLTASDNKVDGVLLVRVRDFANLNIAFAQNFALDAEIKLYDRESKLLGRWRDEASRRNVAITLDPLSAVLTLIKTAVIQESYATRNNLVFDWAFNITARIPGFSGNVKRPSILRVVTNVTEEPFKLGDQVAVGVEGDRGLKASFDLGTFRKNISMNETRSGIYQGAYVIQEGDLVNRAQITVRLMRSRGEQREWTEMHPLATIDGKPPAPPSDLKWSTKEGGLLLEWNSTDTDLAGFLVQRSLNPLADYQDMDNVSGFEWWDRDMEGGQTYFYRVVAKDQAGNLSKPMASGKVIIPKTGETSLTGNPQGELVAGVYRLNEEVVVLPGMTLNLAPGVTILAGPKGRLEVQGHLSGDNVVFRLQSLTHPKPSQTGSTESVDDAKPSTDDPSESAENPAESADDSKPSTDDPAESADNPALSTEGVSVSKEPDTENMPPRWQGIRVSEGGRATLKGVVFQACRLCLEIRGGTAHVTNGSWRNGGVGLMLDSVHEVIVEESRFQTMETAVMLQDGNLAMRQATLTRNGMGIHASSGSLSLKNVNLFDNAMNLKTTFPVILEGNYLGSLIPNMVKVEGPVTIRSLLDAPWPGGKSYVIDPETLARQAKEKKELGLEAFSGRQYGQAYEYLKASLTFKEDREVRLSLAFVLNALGRKEELEILLAEGMTAYPNEVRFFNLAIRNFLSAGRREDAKTLLHKALKLNPESAMLIGLKFMVEE